LSEERVIVKLEAEKGKNHTLDHEFGVYMKLRKGIGIPRTHWFGMEAGYNVLVIERLGPNLDELFVQCNFQFSLKTVLLLARQLVSSIFNTEPRPGLSSAVLALSPPVHPFQQLHPP
jgi:hypothetical protein